MAMALPVGSNAPDFTLRSKSTNGLVDVKLSELLGEHSVVLLFFPGAFTGVCTQQMHDVSAKLPEFKTANAVVFGISCDTPFSQFAWAEKEDFTVPFLSDYQHQVTELYDVVLPDLAGIGPSSQRAAFVIDKQGVIRYSEQMPKLTDIPSADAILDCLETL